MLMLRHRARVLWLAAGLLTATISLLPAIPQPPSYHDFADQSSCLGLAHCADTLSNLLFVVAGVAGLAFLHGAPVSPGPTYTLLSYRLFFAAVILVGLASGYYHLAPDNDRLLWDRAAIVLALSAWFAAVLGERAGTRRALYLLPALGLIGLVSVAYWYWSESQGRGDLRPYLLVQALPMLLVPLLLRLYPPRYGSDRDILMVPCLYLLALLGEVLDRQIAALTGLVSGHTLKHLLAAAAVGWVVLVLRRRLPP